MSLYLAARIAASLFEPRNFVEEWSRRIVLYFLDFKAAYCLAVTFLWCAFFAVHSTGMRAVVAYRMGIENWLIYSGMGFSPERRGRTCTATGSPSVSADC